MKPGVKTSEFFTTIVGGLVILGLLFAEFVFHIQIDDNTKMTILSMLGLQSVYVAARSYLKTKLDSMAIPSGFRSTEFIIVAVTIVGIVGMTIANLRFGWALSDTTRDMVIAALGSIAVYVVGRGVAKSLPSSSSSSIEIVPGQSTSSDPNSK